MVNNQENIVSSANKEINLRKIISSYTRHWVWFLLSLIVFVVLAFLHLRYATPEYNAYAKIMLLDDENTSTPAASVLKDLRKFSESESTKVEDEIEVLKSRSLMELVVKKLKLNVRFYTEGRFHNTQLFQNPPVKVNFIASDSVINASKLTLNIEVVSNTELSFSFNEDIQFKKGHFGKSIESPIGEILITPNDNISNYVGKKLFISITPTYKVAEHYKRKISISQAAEYSKIINISLNDAVGRKARMIIDTLVSEYNRTSIEEKNKKSKRAADFIDERISLISADLSRADDKVEQFKTGNKLTDIVSEADLYLNSSAQTEQELDLKKTELSKINYMEDIIEDESAPFSRIPSNVGLSDNSANLTAAKINELLNDRDRLLKSSGDKNPIIVNLDQQIGNLKNSLKQSLNNSRKTVDLEIKSLENRSNKLSSKIFAVPGQVRKTRDMEREQGTKEALFLYLLEKREEATISLTSTSSRAKIIDQAYSPNLGPVSPNKKMAYIAAIFLGLCIPFSIIYASELLNTKIHNREDLEKEIHGISILGEVPKIKSKEKGLVERNDRSILSESFRIIRTNFDYVRRGRDVENYENVIFITSTINGEGKSFFSLNMALTLANTGKRVLLLGADVRNPQIYSAIKKKKEKKHSKTGLTEFLVDKSIIIGETINNYNINDIDIDILLSGKVPPNPAELLMNNRTKELFDSVSNQYDYVIVDTAPAMLVTDTLLISQYAGHTIYITRAGYTEKRILNFAKELHADKKLNGMMLVVNDVKQSNFGYGARYGYYGKKEKKSFFKRRRA